MDLLIGQLADAAEGKATGADINEVALKVFAAYEKTRDLYHPSEELAALVAAQEPCGGVVTAAMAADLIVAAHTLAKQVGSYAVHHEIKRRAWDRGLA